MKFLPLGFLLLVIFLFYWFFGFDDLKWETVRRFQKEVVEVSLFRALLIFSFIYTERD